MGEPHLICGAELFTSNLRAPNGPPDANRGEGNPGDYPVRAPSLSLHSSPLHRSPWLPYDLENEGGKERNGASVLMYAVGHQIQVVELWVPRATSAMDDKFVEAAMTTRAHRSETQDAVRGPHVNDRSRRARVWRAGPACRRPYQIRLHGDLAKWADSRELGPTRPSLFLFPFYFSILFSFFLLDFQIQI
jgi:hypothetical protein